MATHLWLYPWFALVVGLVALILGWATARDSPRLPIPRTARSLLVLWALVIAGSVLATLHIGVTAGFDFLAARGLLLGALGGVGLVFLSRWSAAPTPALPAMLLGLGTVVTAAGRLWLTHGEIAGLTALVLGAALSVFCLGVAPSLLPGERGESAAEASTSAALGLLYMLSLAATVALGFTRAGALGEMYWVDLPLLLGAALSLGMAVSAALVRRRPGFLARVLPLLVAALVVLLPLSRLTPITRLAGLLLLGALLFALLARLSARLTSAVEGAAFGDSLGPLVGFVMVVAGATLAFALASGYGLGLFVLGGWFASHSFFAPAESESLVPDRPNSLAAVSALGFTSLLLVYRLAVLQNNPAVRASGPGDTWDLFAVCLGALLPLLASEWARLDGQAGRLPSWAVTLQWVLSLALPAVILDYIWQPRSVTGLLLGAALGQLLTGLAGDARRRFATVSLSGVLLSLVLFQFLPALGHLDMPSRSMRIGLILISAVLLLLRLLVPMRLVRRASA